MMPAACWIILFEYPTHFVEAFGGIVVFCLLFGVPAISIGWILHCIAVMIRGVKDERKEDAG